MKGSSFVALTAGVAAIVTAVPVVAHHAFAAEFDANKPLTITGTVTSRMASHARFYVDERTRPARSSWDFGSVLTMD